MSWNIETIGDSKTLAINPANGAVGESEIINFINLVIRQINADIVSIMEVRSGAGARILGWLLPRLNNGAAAGGQWLGRVSARQDGGTQEETLCLWRARLNVLTLDPDGVPAPISSIGIVDRNLLQSTFAALGIWNNAATEHAFLAALNAAGYTGHGTYAGPGNSRPLTRTWWVNSNRWRALTTMAPPAQVNFGATPLPVAPLTAAQLQLLASQLIGADILRFVSYADRTPLLANFLVGNPPKRLMLGVLHALGPQDPLRTDAINVLGLSSAAAAAANLVLMGDWNIAANQGNKTGAMYGRFQRPNGEFVFARLQPKVVQQVFAPVVGFPLLAPDQALLPDPRTTMVRTWLDDTAPVNSMLGSTYDKVFLRVNANPALAVTGAHPTAWNMIERLAPGQAVPYWQDAARSALTFFRAYRGDAFLQKADDKLEEIEDEAQRTYTTKTDQALMVQAQLQGMNPKPPLNAQIYTRLANYNKAATAAAQLGIAARFQRDAIAELRLLIAGAGTDPTGTGSALAIYREAISNHFPISIELTA